jgi:spore maturation protein B
MTEMFRNIVNALAAFAVPVVLLVFIGWGIVRRVKVYEVFVDGAKEGFQVSLRIIPYLVAMLVAIGIFRASGAMDLFVTLLNPITRLIGMPPEVLPMAVMRPLSGSASLGIMTDLMRTHGPDSFIGILASTMYGSSETTFYVLAVYFSAVGIKNVRHSVLAGIIADIVGMLAALWIVRIFVG